MTTKTAGFDPQTTYVQLHDGGAADAFPIDDRFWEEIYAKPELHSGRLLGAFFMAESLETSEMHPNGDELLLLLSGKIDIVLEEPGGDRVIELEPGRACVVPAGVWHRQVVREPGAFVFITPGEGTQHRNA